MKNVLGKLAEHREFAILFCLSLGMRLSQMGRSFRLHEYYALDFAYRFSLSDYLVRHFGLDGAESNGMLFYVLLRSWLSLGESVYLEHLLSLIFFAGSLPLLYVIGLRFGRKTAVFGTFFFSANSLALVYSQHCRFYSLNCFLVLLMSYLWLKYAAGGSARPAVSARRAARETAVAEGTAGAAQGPGAAREAVVAAEGAAGAAQGAGAASAIGSAEKSWIRWLEIGAASAGAVLTMIASVLAFPAHIVYLLMRQKSGRAWLQASAFASGAAFLVGLLSYLDPSASQRLGPYSDTGTSAEIFFQWLGVMPAWIACQYMAQEVPVIIMRCLLGTLAVLGICQCLRRRSPLHVWLCLICFVPPAVIWSYSLLVRNICSALNCYYILPYMAILMGLGLAGLRRCTAWLILAIMLAVSPVLAVNIAEAEGISPQEELELCSCLLRGEDVLVYSAISREKDFFVPARAGKVLPQGMKLMRIDEWEKAKRSDRFVWVLCEGQFKEHIAADFTESGYAVLTERCFGRPPYYLILWGRKDGSRNEPGS